MKRIFLFIALLFTIPAIAGIGNDSTQVVDSGSRMVRYPVWVKDARFCYDQSPAGSLIRNVIAGTFDSLKKVPGLTLVDTSTILIHISLQQFIDVMNNNRMLYEGIAADVNARLLNKGTPLIMQESWLRKNVFVIRDLNERAFDQSAENGRKQIDIMIKAWNQ